MKRILAKCAMCAMFVALASCGAVKPKQQNLNIFNELDIEFGDAKEDVMKKLKDAGVMCRLNDDDYDIYNTSYMTTEFNTDFIFVSFDFDDDKLHKLKTGSFLNLNEEEMKKKLEDIIDRFNKRGYKVTQHGSDSLEVNSNYWTMLLLSDRIHENLVSLKMNIEEL